MSPPTGSAPPRYYVNSWAARTGQRIAARVIDSMLAFGCVVAVIVIGPHGRPLAQDLVIVALVATIESVAITRTGATAGMHVLDLRVASVGRAGHPDWLAAWRRTIPIALCYPVLVPGLFSVLVMPVALLTSISLSPLRRGFHDRLSGTVVVQAGAPERITDEDMASWWHPGLEVVLSPWGRVPDLYERRRARAHRADGAWWLAALIMVATIASVGMRDVPKLWLWSTAAWLAVVTIDEVWWISTRGATPGHARFGYRVVDMETGEIPTRSRAILRAVVLAPLLYVPPLQLVLALWVRASSLHRGPHDLLANTIVVEPGHLPHTFVRAPPVVPYAAAMAPVAPRPRFTARPSPLPGMPPAPFAPPGRPPPPPPHLPGPF
jgi:uncharacterized RDD family membrane protein YckC